MSMRITFRPSWCRNLGSVLLALASVLLINVTDYAVAQDPISDSGAAVFGNPVIPGDHPDPSIIRVGETYWMSSTSDDWSPQFPLFRSSDLHHWIPAGAIFPHQPSWATGSFWAPELVYDHGHVLVYYVGRKRQGPLCVAVATAPNPGGPYTDHGPIECQQDGSIDPAFARDENGKPYLIWKEDGNSIHKPTPLWAQPLTFDLLHPMGKKVQLIVNDPGSWEGGVVEAPYVLHHDGHFYLFYAGNACCGTECNYAEGVARADRLLGPYEKDPANPVIRADATWKCPGHGSAVTTPSGENYFLYHAYPREGSIYLGRESVLDQIKWTPTGWPTINSGQGPGETPTQAPAVLTDQFASQSLGADWHWPVNRNPKVRVGNGSLTLTVGARKENFIAHSLGSSEYVSSVLLQPGGTALGSLTVIGNAKHSFGLGRLGPKLELWRQDGQLPRRVLWHQQVSKAATLHLRVTSSDLGKQLTYGYSLDGEHWLPAGNAIDVSTLPQWDQGLRVGLDVQGSAGSPATFRAFTLQRR